MEDPSGRAVKCIPEGQVASTAGGVSSEGHTHGHS